MSNPFKKGDKVIVPLKFGNDFTIKVKATIVYAHALYGWCTCDLGPYRTSYWVENIYTPQEVIPTQEEVFDLNTFNYAEYYSKWLKKRPKRALADDFA